MASVSNFSRLLGALSCLGVIRPRNHVLEYKPLKREVVGSLGCGLLGLHRKGLCAGEVFITSRNWHPVAARPQMSKNHKDRRRKRLD